MAWGFLWGCGRAIPGFATADQFARSVADGAVTDGSVADGAITDGSVADRSVADGSVADGSVAAQGTMHWYGTAPHFCRLIVVSVGTVLGSVRRHAFRDRNPLARVGGPGVGATVV
ncbi:MAG: hypothetical protein ACKODB_14680, partial [Betaproteobacteria bacterium]